MPLATLSLVVVVLLIAGYRLYGGWVAKNLSLNPKVITPAHTENDGVDFIPTKPFYLFGQHFSAISAAGPIAGPILAAQQFGWLPAILWIVLGVIFIGAVHDFSSLIASVRHRGHSIAEIMGQHLGKRAGTAMMAFIWLCLIYVIVAFTDITAGTFIGQIQELEGVEASFNRGGAVAMASILYLILSMILGIVQKTCRIPLWILTLVFVPLTLFVVWVGTEYSTLFILSQKHWALLILLYCLVASLLPAWLLLQPRGYLGGFILFLVLFIGLVGIFLGGYEIQLEAFKTWQAPGVNGALFPFLFVTIACGACSGFHGLVCSGTTSKQIDRENHCRPIGYGAMLLEALVALIALATLLILSTEDIKGSPGAIYGAGMGRFMTLLIGEEHLTFAMTFGAMAFSTFVFDTLDVAMRLGRYIIQELIGKKGLRTAIGATALTTGLAGLLIHLSQEGGWSLFWVLFGTSNQLLAGLTLLGVTVWLYRSGRNYRMTLYPMIFVLTITTWSLLHQIASAWHFIQKEGWNLSVPTINGMVALTLLALALFVGLEAIKLCRSPKI